MDYVSTKRTFLILGITFFVAVSIPVSVYLFKKESFDIRNLAGEEDSTDTQSTGSAETTEDGVGLEEDLTADDTSEAGTSGSSSQDSAQEEEIDADLDEDGKIGVSDYYIFINDFDDYKSGGLANSRSDFDQDDEIDMADYALFFEEYSL